MSKDILPFRSHEELLPIIAMAPFSHSDEDNMIIVSIVAWGSDKTNVLPYVSEYQGKELAYRCLLSLALFKEAIEYRRQRHGAPGVKYYRVTGQNEFYKLNMNSIGDHFEQWECFLGEVFV